MKEMLLPQLAGWNGLDCISEGLFSYRKCISWIRLYIQIAGSEFYGGISGTGSDFELAREDGCWLRYPCRPAWTAAGEPVLPRSGCLHMED